MFYPQAVMHINYILLRVKTIIHIIIYVFRMSYMCSKYKA